MILSRKNKKPDFETIGQMYVEVTETTANVVNIKQTVRDQWGDEYTIVTTEGLEIEDSSATQGWLI